ncbi:TVP38/TMEM64 family protein [Candidatus Clostridium stratigraminis]|uniref:TVP38/TMEM64 family membrane protein n=1 Tax=Candidatus Clostridium stratigraminis TaxID=3381661 RepID=A0ABW8T2I8_9CLOT
MKDSTKSIMKITMTNTIKILIILCISIIFIYLLFKYQKRVTHIRLKDLRSYIVSFGPYAAIVFIFLFTIKAILIFFPTMIFTAIAGNIFGPFLGFFITIVGLFTSATVAFFLSKFLGKSFANKVTRGKLLKLDDNIEQHGFKIMLLMRLSTLFPFDPLSYAAGLTKLSYFDFITATIIGSAPEMLAYSFVGHNMLRPSIHKIIIPILLIIVFAILGSYLYKTNVKVNK